MKIKIIRENGKVFFVLKYENDEYEKVREIMEKLELEIRETSNGFGVGQTLKFYREPSAQFINYLKSINTKFDNIKIYSDINAYFYNDGYTNIAILRVVPNEQGEVKVLLDKLLTVQDLYNIVVTLKEVFTVLFNLVLDKEITLEFKRAELKI